MHQSTEGLLNELRTLNIFLWAHDGCENHPGRMGLFYDFEQAPNSHKKAPHITVGTIKDITVNTFFKNNVVISSKVEYNTGCNPLLDEYFGGNYYSLIDFLHKYKINFIEADSEYYRDHHSKRRVRYIKLMDTKQGLAKKLEPHKIRIFKALLHNSESFFAHVRGTEDRVKTIVKIMKDKELKENNGFVVTKNDVQYHRSRAHDWDLGTGYIKFCDMGLKSLQDVNQVLGLGFAILEERLAEKGFSLEESLNNGYVSLRTTGNNHSSVYFDYHFPAVVEKPAEKILSDW